MKLSLLFLIAFASTGLAGVLAPDLSDPPPGPLQFFQQTQWIQPLSSPDSPMDYSLLGSLGAERAIRSVEGSGPNESTLLTGESAQSLSAKLLGGQPASDDLSLRLLSGLVFSIPEGEHRI